MLKFEYTIKDKLGIHARPAGMLAKTAKGFESEITVEKGEKNASAKKLMALMSLGVRHGDTVIVTAKGADEEKALSEIKAFFETNL